MGLDSMPTTLALTEPSSNQQLQPRLVRYSQYNPMDLLNVAGRMEMHHWRQSRQPMERFQTETLPPKSAKSIPVTHYKLLSPIRCPRFVSSKNVAYIAEAAAKIMEASPRAVNNTIRVPSIVSPSVPMRIRDLKQKMEAAHRVSRPGSSSEPGKSLKAQHRDNSNSGSSSAGSSSFRRPPKASPEMDKGKSVQQRPGGSTTRSNNNRIKPKEKNEIKSQPNIQTSVHKKPIENRSNVLRQNNQKQNNSLSRMTTSTSKQGDIAITQLSNGSSGSSRTVTTVSMNSEKEKRKASPHKKQDINVDPSNRRASASRLSNKDSRAIECKVAVNESMKSMVNGKNSMDVVSFTFTSPMVRNNISKSSSSSDGLTRNSIGLNMIGGDELGVLLERKLRELTDKVESSTGLLKPAPLVNVMSAATSSAAEQKVSELSLDKVELHKAEGEWYSEENLLLHSHHERKVCFLYHQSEAAEEHSCSSSYIENGKVLESEPPNYTEWILDQTCSDSQGSDQQCSSSVQAPTTFNSASTNRTLTDEGLKTELSDSATSSISMMLANHLPNTTSPILPGATTKLNKYPSNWELDYVIHILYIAEMNLEDLALSCSPSKILSPNLFEHEESKFGRDSDELSLKINRKVMFDCIGEFLDYKCRKRSWDEHQGVLLERKGCLAKELHKEVLGWKSMGDMMVDDLVDRDMSCGDR
ncbi:unnamed protein product, partial [Linum tenue]